MTNPFQQHGAFSWFEIMTTDAAAAKEFYGKLFGWEMRDQQMPDIVYTVLKAAGKDIGGLMPMPPNVPKGMPPSWGIYVTVEDVDASAKLAEELGAKIIVPMMDIPDVGRFCQIQDPQGATISMITYAKPSSEEQSDG